MELKLKELREEMRMTQRELAEKISNSQRNVSNWENGITEPDLETVVRLCGVFQTTIEELLGLEPHGAERLSAEEWRLLRALRGMSQEQRSAVCKMVEAFSTRKES